MVQPFNPIAPTPSGPTDVTGALADYAAVALGRDLPPQVAQCARHHLLDTLAAMLSGSRLPAGAAAIAYARGLPRSSEAGVLGTDLFLRATDAALVNGMSAHADETDDTHARSLTHPGSVVVPAALAVAERCGSSGNDLLRAVALGYDVCCRMGVTLGAYDFFHRGYDPHAFGGIFGAAFAAGALMGFDATQFRYLASYAAQQASGVTTWVRDSQHVEKAFDFAGMPARNGVEAALLVQAGFTGVRDVFDGAPNFLNVLNPEADARLLVEDLGTRFEIGQTTIKKWCVATPAQASLDGVKALVETHRLAADAIVKVTATIPAMSARVVTGREMPNVNVEHLLALLLVDGDLTFHSTHDVGRMADPKVLAARRRVQIVPSETMPKDSRGAVVTVETADGRRLVDEITQVRGTPGNPMSEREIVAKVRDLMEPILGSVRCEKLVEQILSAEKIKDARSVFKSYEPIN
jgi:2-methylcitrate dehydratase PrpD